MNKLTNQGKSKLKTLPNQIGTHHQEFLFQSQCDEDYLKKINMASPTFATTQLGSLEQNHNDKTMRVNQANKENRISLSLKQYKNDDNGNFLGKQNSLQFMKGQNEKLVQKCTNLNTHNKELQIQNLKLKDKINILKKIVSDKLQKQISKLVEFIQKKNSSPDQDNIDLYLEVQVFKSNYKMYEAENKNFRDKNQILQNKIKQLEEIIINYTQKSEKKKMQKEENVQKIEKLQKIYTQKFQQLKRKNQARIRECQIQKLQKQKALKKIKDQYQKLKFLKQQIQKKRQEDFKCRQQLQNTLKDKQQYINMLKQQYEKSQQQIISKLAQNSQNFEQQLVKSNEQLRKLKLSLSSLQTQNGKYKHSMENYKLVNQKYSQQITSLRKQNQQFYQNVQSLKLQKDRLQCLNQKHVLNQQRQTKKINQLQLKINDTQRQMEQIKQQFQQWLVKNSSRSHPDISKFKVEQQQSQKQITSRGSESQKCSINTERFKKMQSQFNAIILSLNKQIEELRKTKQSLQLQLFSQRERCQKINIQLQNTYRKIQQFNYNDYQREGRDKNMYMKKDTYGTSVFPFEVTRATKAAPQLRMIKQILSQILNYKQMDERVYKDPSNIYRQKDREQLMSVEDLIEDIKNLSEETADFFDDREKQIQDLIRKIKHKEEVISKLLKFTPEQKKGCILDYLKVMQAYEEYPIQQVFNVTKVLQQQASEWKRSVNNLIDAVQKNQQELMILRRQVNKYKSQGGIRRLEPSLGNGDRDKFQKYERDRNQRNVQKWEYQRKRY